MDRVTVYRFKCYDVTADRTMAGPTWGTLDAIDTLNKCIALAESAREVAASLVNEDGFVVGELED